MTRSIEVPGLHHGKAPIPAASINGGLLVSSGINGMDPETGKLVDTVEEQAALIFANLQRIVEAAGGTVADVVKCTFFVKDGNTKDPINREWLELFPDPAARPARHTLIQNLADHIHLQCEIIAFIPGGNK